MGADEGREQAWGPHHVGLLKSFHYFEGEIHIFKYKYKYINLCMYIM